MEVGLKFSFMGDRRHDYRQILIMRTLREIFEDYAHYGSDAGHADKGSTHSYIEEYERLFEPYRSASKRVGGKYQTGVTFMEIGLALGWSMKMWAEYFHNSRLVGVDISIVFDSKKINCWENQLIVIEADATDPEFVKKLDGFLFDVIIDDGSHMTNDQVTTFNLLKNKMNKGGLYVIEDILALDSQKEVYLSLHDNCEIIDLRQKKNRFDDVLILYRF